MPHTAHPRYMSGRGSIDYKVNTLIKSVTPRQLTLLSI